MSDPTDPRVIERIDSGTIKQTIVTDCSFIASLAIAARYERRFGKKLITKFVHIFFSVVNIYFFFVE
jgi:calpain-7